MDNKYQAPEEIVFTAKEMRTTAAKILQNEEQRGRLTEYASHNLKQIVESKKLTDDEVYGLWHGARLNYKVEYERVVHGTPE